MDGKNILKKSFIFVGSSLGYLIGASFMSGQETIQFYVPFGYGGALVGITLAVSLILVNLGFIYAGRHGELKKGTDVYKYFLGPVGGKIFEWYVIFVCFMITIAEFAGAGAILNEQYGFSVVIGSLATAVLTSITVMSGLKAVLNTLGIITPILGAFIIFVGAVTLIENGADISYNVDQIAKDKFDLLTVAPNWLFSGFLLAGLIIIILSRFTTDLAIKYETKPILVGQSIGLGLYAVLDIFVSFAIISVVDQVAHKQIVNLFLAKEIWAPFGLVFGLLIFLAIYTLCTPIVHVIAMKFNQRKTKANNIIIIVVCTLAFLISVTLPFNTMINIVYKTAGYGGGLLVIFMIIKFIRILLNSKKNDRR